MVKILISRQSRYPANTKEIKKRILEVLKENNVSEGTVSLAFVGKRKMLDLAKKYLGEEKVLHEVLTFPYSENGLLGDIAICYPEARRIAQKRNRMVDDVLGELAEHGTKHILGKHHGEVPEKLTN